MLDRMASGGRYRKGSLFSAAASGDDRIAVLDPNKGDPANAYRHGYFEAALALVREGNRVPTDTAIYPIVFLFRHAVELSLKELIAGLWNMERKAFPKLKTHDLATLWKLLRPELDQWLATNAGETMPDSSEVDELIADLAAFDPDGVPFRYPTTPKGQDCHPPLSTINLDTLAHWLSRAEDSFCEWTFRLREQTVFLRHERAVRAGRK